MEAFKHYERKFKKHLYNHYVLTICHSLHKNDMIGILRFLKIFFFSFHVDIVIEIDEISKNINLQLFLFKGDTQCTTSHASYHITK